MVEKWGGALRVRSPRATPAEGHRLTFPACEPHRCPHVPGSASGHSPLPADDVITMGAGDVPALPEGPPTGPGAGVEPVGCGGGASGTGGTGGSVSGGGASAIGVTGEPWFVESGHLFPAVLDTDMVRAAGETVLAAPTGRPGLGVRSAA
ncbi:hypothetical protein GCM10010517_55500 [Streptosporangium fragile]|uniref:Uncharacterized protein n=2 Tax=Streptosporangium fragile TaxID=46186 RepID=A0ABN3W5B8_9ACTN